MGILNLTEGSKVYTSNAYLVMGEWNTLGDTNTLIDVGNDKGIIDIIENTYTGVGKNKIDQVILTHTHSDHSGILPLIKEKYNPKVYAFNEHFAGVDHVLKDGQEIRIGEKYCEIIHITSHSYDSICVYCKENGVLFAGDTFFPLAFENDLMKAQNAFAVSKLERKRITWVYYGHGAPHDYRNKKFIAYRK